MALFRKKPAVPETADGGAAPEAEEAKAPEKKQKAKKTPRSGHAIAGRRVVLGAACLLGAALIAFVLLPRMYGAENEKVAVLRLTQTVEAGTVITDDMVAEVEVSAYHLPYGFVKARSEAVGKVALDRLYSGEFLWAARLVEQSEYEGILAEETKGLTDGYCLVSIHLSGPASGVAGVLRPGDVVDVFEARMADTAGSYSVKLVLPELYVYDVRNQALASLAEPDGGTAQDAVPTYIVFRCTENQAKELIRLERENALHLVLK